MKLAIAGVGNNISALCQGVEWYRRFEGEDLPGVARPTLGGIHVTDLDVVAAFDVSPTKVGRPLHDALSAEPNNYPNLGVLEPGGGPTVSHGLVLDPAPADRAAVVAELKRSGSDVLLYSLPTGLGALARAYAEAAIEAGVAFVNCTRKRANRPVSPGIARHRHRFRH